MPGISFLGPVGHQAPLELSRSTLSKKGMWAIKDRRGRFCFGNRHNHNKRAGDGRSHRLRPKALSYAQLGFDGLHIFDEGVT
jgi:hypothetical protein